MKALSAKQVKAGIHGDRDRGFGGPEFVDWRFKVMCFNVTLSSSATENDISPSLTI